MAMAVIGARYGMRSIGLTSLASLLVIEVVVGIITYVSAAPTLAPDASRDFLQLLRRSANE